MDSKLKTVRSNIALVQVWNRQGGIVYSDNESTIGHQFALGAPLKSALSGQVVAGLTATTSPDTTANNSTGTFLQVYAPVTLPGSSAPDGAIELYLPYGPVLADVASQTRWLYLVIAAGLLVFYASMFPVLVVADRWRRGYVLSSAIVDDERRRGQEAQRLSDTKSQFLASMSHELRTPLNSILGFSELLLDPARTIGVERRTAYLGNIHQSGQHLLDLVNDILDMSKVEAGRMTVEPQVLPLAEVLVDAVASVDALASAKSIRIAVRASRGTRLLADPRHARQVVLNLLGNAIKFTPEGGRIRLAARQAGPEVLISVADNGPGIADADQERIFHAFERAGAASSHVTGTGLGLALTRRLVELNGGHVRLRSVVGKGSIFTAAFPALEDTLVSTLTVVEGHQPSGSIPVGHAGAVEVATDAI
jgi:signal transduction histidine kinase